MNRLLLTAFTLLSLSCGNREANGLKAQTTQPTTNENMTQKLYLTINGQTLSATLVNNSSAKALVEALAKAPITYEAHDYGNFEKVGSLGQSFPRNDEQVTTQPGDLILYQGNNLCIYYDTNSWSFTRIGHLDNVSKDEIKRFVNAGGGNVTVTLSLSVPTAIRQVDAHGKAADTYYTLAGTPVRTGDKGIYIKNGKKAIKR